MRKFIAQAVSPALPAILILLLISVFVPRARAQEIAKNNGAPVLRAALLAPPAPAERPAGAANFRPDATPARRKMSRAQRRAWYLLGLAQPSAFFFDARTTRGAMRHTKSSTRCFVPSPIRPRSIRSCKSPRSASIG